MTTELKSYINNLISIGRRVSCFEKNASKPSEVLTIKQQEAMTGYFVKEGGLTISDCISFDDEGKLLNMIANFLIEDTVENATLLLKTLREAILKNFYDVTDNLLIETLAEYEVDCLKESGATAKIDQQTGETIWT